MQPDTSSLWATLIGSGVTLSQFLFFYTLYPILLSLASSRADKMLGRLLSQHNAKTLSGSLHDMATSAFQNAITKSYDEWNAEYRVLRKHSPERHGREGRERLDSERSLAKKTKAYLVEYAGVIVAGDMVPFGDPQHLSALLSSSESLSEPIRKGILQKVHEMVPNCPDSLWRSINRILLPELGRELSKQFSESGQGKFTSEIAGRAEFAELIQELNKFGESSTQIDTDRIARQVIEGMSERFVYLLAEPGSNESVESLLKYQDWLNSALLDFKRDFMKIHDSQEKIQGVVEDIYETVRPKLEKFGFRSLKQILSQKTSIPPQPWPGTALQQWPTLADFEAGLVVQSSAARELIERLARDPIIPSIHGLVGRNDSGKSITALSIGYALLNSDTLEWDVMVLQGDQIGDVKHVDELVVYEFVEHLRTMPVLDRPLLLIIDDIQADTRKILRLYEDWHYIPPLSNIHLLLVGSEAITDHRNIQGKKITTDLAENDLLIHSAMTYDDFVQCINLSLRYFGREPDKASLDDPALRRVYEACRQNWTVLRILLGLNSYELKNNVNPLSALIQARLDQNTLLTSLYKHLRIGSFNIHTSAALRDVAALASLGIWTQRQFVDTSANVKIDELMNAGLIKLVGNDLGYTIGGNISASIMLKCIIASGSPALNDFLNHEYRRIQIDTVQRYLLHSPINYLHVLRNPRYRSNHERRVLREAFGESEHSEVLENALFSQLNNEPDPEEHVRALVAIYATDRELARRLLIRQGDSLRAKIVLRSGKSDLVEQIHLVAHLHVISPPIARSVLSGLRLRSATVANSLYSHAEQNDIEQVAHDLHQLRLVHRVDPRFVRSVRSELLTDLFWNNIERVMQLATLTQLAIALGGLQLLDVEKTRRILSRLPNGQFQELCEKATTVELTRDIEILAHVDPAYLSSTVTEWTNTEKGFISKLFNVFFADSDRERACAQIARIAGANRDLGYALARQIDASALADWWRSSGGTLSTLNSILYSLRISYRHKATALESELLGEQVTKAFRAELHRPRLLAYGLRNLLGGYLPLAREIGDFLVRDKELLETTIEAWIRNGKLPALCQFLIELSELEERNARRTIGQTQQQLLYQEVAKECLESFTMALRQALDRNDLEIVSSCYDELSSSSHLLWFARRVTDQLVPDFQVVLYDREHHGLARTMKLLQAVNKVDKAIIASLMQWSPPGQPPIKARLLTNFESRVHLKISPLHEIGLFLAFTAQIDPSLAEPVLRTLDWTTVVEEITNLDRLGRLSIFVSGLASVSEQVSLEESLAIKLVEAISEAWDEETSLPQLNSVINHLSVLGVSVGEQLYSSDQRRKEYCELIEREPRLEIVAQSLNLLAKTSTPAYEYVIKKLDKRALAGKLEGKGLLHLLLFIVKALARNGEWVKLDVLSPAGEELLAIIGEDSISYLLQRERNAATLAIALHVMSRAASSRAFEILNQVDARETALRLSGIVSVVENKTRKINLSGMRAQDMLYRFTGWNGVAELASLLYASSKIDPRWTNQLLDELNTLYSSLNQWGDEGGESVADFITEVAYSSRPDILASTMFVREIVGLARQESSHVLDALHTRISVIDFDTQKNPGRVAWAIWVLSKTPQSLSLAEHLTSLLKRALEAAGIDIYKPPSTLDDVVLLLCLAVASEEVKQVLDKAFLNLEWSSDTDVATITIAEVEGALFGSRTADELIDSWEQVVPWHIYSSKLKVWRF